MRIRLIHILAFSLTSSCLHIYAQQQLDIQQAIQLVLENSPELHIAELDVAVKEAEESQAGKWPNPSVTLELDNLGGGKGKHRGFKNAEVSYSISQLFVIGGKLSLLRDIASAKTEAACWELAIARMNILERLEMAFIDAAVAQEKFKLAQKQFRNAEYAHACSKEKMESGKSSLIQVKKSEIAMFSCKVAFEKTRTEFETAKKTLALFWGGSSCDFDFVFFPLFDIQPLPSLCELQTFLENSPEIFKNAAEQKAASFVRDLECAQQIPDVEISTGVGTEGFCNDQSFFVSFTFPLPVFDRNQGNIARARYEEWQVLYRRESIEIEQKARLANAYQQWYTAFLAANTLAQLSSSSAMDTLNASDEAYQQGKIEYLEYLDTQRTIFDINSQFIDAAADYHRKKAEVRRVTGRAQSCFTNEG